MTAGHYQYTVRYHVLATDYDGTLAWEGQVAPATLNALRRLRASGRKVVLVTGRELPDLLRAFSAMDSCDAVVAENGGVLFLPATRETRVLGPPPPPRFIEQLRRRGVNPLNVGQVIVSTRQPNEAVVLELIRELGLELQVVFNQGAVMVLPSGINKGSGLQAACSRLGWSLHNCVGLGDAENDHALLAKCECAVVVANAVPALRDTADWATSTPNGSGAVALMERLLADDLRPLAARLGRHRIPVGTRPDGSELGLEPYGTTVLIAGSSGGGKSSIAMGILERLFQRGYQVCVIDPEGDYEELEGAVTLGSPRQPPELERVVQMLTVADHQVVVNLVGLPMADRAAFLLALLGRLAELRAATGHPHWLLIDEAHPMLHRFSEPGSMIRLEEPGSMVVITAQVGRLQRSLLERVDWLLAVGPDAAGTLRTYADAIGAKPPEIQVLDEQAPLVWRRGEPVADRVSFQASRSARRRHRRKYAQGELGEDESFCFRGPDGRLNLRAQNLVVFNQLAEGVDDDTWLFHLRRGDYSGWLLRSVKDEALAGEIAEIERSPGSAAETRHAVREAIDRRYTLAG